MRLNEAKKREIFKKIEIARKAADNILQKEKQSALNGFPAKLKKAADRSELIMNDLNVKRYRCQTAFQKMSECEKQLDKLLSESVSQKDITTNK